MQHRAADLKGQLQTFSENGTGTTVELKFSV